MSTSVATKKRAGLTPERIVLAAVELIDTYGLPAFSMRKLGRALDVEAMSLYEHFANKEAILLAVRAHFYNQLDVPLPPDTTWHDELRSVLMASYLMGVEHPSFVAVHLHVLSVPASRRRGERDMALLRDAGFTEDEAAGAMLALVSYMVGFLHRMVLITPAANPLAHKSRDSAFQLGLDAIFQGLRALALQRSAERA